MELSSELLHAKLKEFFGYNSFKGLQEEVITHLLEGGDAFVLMPTGGGKSLCYQLPALLLEGTAIIISPLIALMKNQVDVIRGMECGSEGIAHFLNSSLNKAQLLEVRSDLQKGVTKLLYVAPESLTKPENVELLKEIKISFYAIDEAHCISEWGHDFRPEYRRIRPIVNEIGLAPIMALTATATPKVQSDIQKNLGMADAKVFKTSFNRPNLIYSVVDKTDPQKDIIKYLRQHPEDSGIIYCLSRKKVEEIAELLNTNGITALPYHAGLDAKSRATNQDAFLMGDVRVIVATIAFGMGIDKPDVRFVIHYDIPKSIEGYYQETGRAGRDGKSADCIAYYSAKDIQKFEKLNKGKPIAEQDINRQLLSEVVGYAESNTCRRKILLKYFGEEYSTCNCAACDNCLHPAKTFDGKEELCLVLSLVRDLKENFKPEHLACILSGEENAMVKSYKHDRLEYFGQGKDRSKNFWLSIIRQGVILNYLSKDIEAYGTTKLTSAGGEFLLHPTTIMLTGERVYSEGKDEDDDEDETPKAGGSGDPVLLPMLKELRKEMAKKLRLQNWIIFGDASLEDMSILYPMTFDELKNCSGVGEGKAKKYGKPFLELISKYVEENEIERPEDFVVKTKVESNRKVQIIQAVDRRLSLEEIGSAVDMDIDELIDELEHIVYSGTKLNLKYILEQIMDKEDIDDLFDYFRNAPTDRIKEAMDEFGSFYQENELRLARLEFLCEVAN